MRALPFLLLAVAVVVVLWPWFRRRRVPSNLPVGPPHELVKDPVCQTYVMRSRAVHVAAGSPYFCSKACAERWAAGPPGW